MSKITRSGFLKRMAFAFTACAFFEMPEYSSEIKKWFQHSTHESAQMIAEYIKKVYPGSKHIAVDWDDFYQEYTA